MGCGRCADACPGGLIRVAEGGTATMLRPRDCWGCTACVKECPANAIVYFLGADMGGRGTSLSVRRSGTTNVWTFTRPDGSTTSITTDATKANKY